MIPALYFLCGFSVLGLILLADHVKSRFDHSPASRRVLAAEALGTAVVAGSASDALWPDAPAALRLGGALLIALPLYIIIAFATVEIWRYRKQEGFDREISRLIREWHHWQETLDRLDWEVKDIERRKAQLEEESGHLEARMRALQDQIEAWEQSGSGLRRMAMAEQWAAELAGLDAETLRSRKEALAARLAMARGEERADLGVQVQMVELALLRRSLAAPGGPAGELSRRLEQLQEARQRADRRLHQIKEELSAWQERKTAFLRKKIPLD